MKNLSSDELALIDEIDEQVAAYLRERDKLTGRKDSVIFVLSQSSVSDVLHVELRGCDAREVDWKDMTPSQRVAVLVSDSFSWYIRSMSAWELQAIISSENPPAQAPAKAGPWIQ